MRQDDTSIPKSLLRRIFIAAESVQQDFGIEAIMIRQAHRSDHFLKLYVVVADLAGFDRARVSDLAARFGPVGLVLSRDRDHFYSCLFLKPVTHLVLCLLDQAGLGRFRRKQMRMIWQSAGFSVAHFNSPEASQTPVAPAPQRPTTMLEFWFWIHLAVSKLERGELFEAMNRLHWIRAFLLTPLLAKVSGASELLRIRHLESTLPEWVNALAACVPKEYSAEAIATSILSAIHLYTQLLDRLGVEQEPSVQELREALALTLARLSVQDLVPGGSNPAAASGLPVHIDRFLATALPRLRSEASVRGIAADGSWSSKDPLTRLDEFSDVDLYVVVDAAQRTDKQWQLRVASELAPCFLIEEQHSKDKSWIVAIYRTPMLRGDINFIGIAEFQARFQDRVILWEENRILTLAQASVPRDSRYNLAFQPKPRWLEERFWPLAVDCVARLDRGELFQAIQDLDTLRNVVIGPLLAIAVGEQARALRRIERRFPKWVGDLSRTVSPYNREKCFVALRDTVRLYCLLRSTYLPVSETDRLIASTVEAWLEDIHLYRATLTALVGESFVDWHENADLSLPSLSVGRTDGSI